MVHQHASMWASFRDSMNRLQHISDLFVLLAAARNCSARMCDNMCHSRWSVANSSSVPILNNIILSIDSKAYLMISSWHQPNQLSSIWFAYHFRYLPHLLRHPNRSNRASMHNSCFHVAICPLPNVDRCQIAVPTMVAHDECLAVATVDDKDREKDL